MAAGLGEVQTDGSHAVAVLHHEWHVGLHSGLRCLLEQCPWGRHTVAALQDTSAVVCSHRQQDDLDAAAAAAAAACKPEDCPYLMNSQQLSLGCGVGQAAHSSQPHGNSQEWLECPLFEGPVWASCHRLQTCSGRQRFPQCLSAVLLGPKAFQSWRAAP